MNSGTVISQVENGRTLGGVISITSTGVLEGGTIAGRVQSKGLLSGDTRLLAGAHVSGGRIAGNVVGDAARPAHIDGARIEPGTRLENVILGQGTRLAPDVILGPNVRFESDALIPGATDLTPALNSLNWLSGDGRHVADLEDDVLAPVDGSSPLSILRSLQLMSEYEPAGNALSQDAANGELLLVTRDSRSAVLPVRVSQAGPGDTEGTWLNEDGDIVFVTANRRVVLAYPVLVDAAPFSTALERAGLQAKWVANAFLRVFRPRADGLRVNALGSAEGSTADAGNGYFSGRPGLSALPAVQGLQTGLSFRPVPGLARATGVALVFEEGGTAMEQEVIPMPADWSALKAALTDLAGVSELRLNGEGALSLRFEGRSLLLRPQWRVEPGQPLPAGAAASITPAGDLNADGTGDFRVRYPNGDVQHFLLYPAPRE